MVDNFYIEDKYNDYKIHLSGSTISNKNRTNLINILKINGMPFITKDHNNSNLSYNCA